VGLVYDSKELPVVTTTRSGVAGVLQMVSEPTLTVSLVRTGQLRRIQWHTGQGHGHVCMTRGSSGRASYTGSKEQNRSLYTFGQDVQITRIAKI
jgi:hypothetical protein